MARSDQIASLDQIEMVNDLVSAFSRRISYVIEEGEIPHDIVVALMGAQANLGVTMDLLRSHLSAHRTTEGS